jgi:hypothetical protein
VPHVVDDEHEQDGADGDGPRPDRNIHEKTSGRVRLMTGGLFRQRDPWRVRRAADGTGPATMATVMTMTSWGVLPSSSSL